MILTHDPHSAAVLCLGRAENRAEEDEVLVEVRRQQQVLDLVQAENRPEEDEVLVEVRWQLTLLYLILAENRAEEEEVLVEVRGHHHSSIHCELAEDRVIDAVLPVPPRHDCIGLCSCSVGRSCSHVEQAIEEKAPPSQGATRCHHSQTSCSSWHTHEHFHFGVASLAGGNLGKMPKGRLPMLSTTKTILAKKTNHSHLHPRATPGSSLASPGGASRAWSLQLSPPMTHSLKETTASPPHRRGPLSS